MPSIANLQPQPQETVLNADGRQAIEDLLQSRRTIKPLKDRLDKAVQYLRDIATEINDREVEEGLRQERKRIKLQARGEEPDEHEHELAQYRKFSSQVHVLTKKLDHGVRGVVDDQIWLEDVPDIIRKLGVETGALPQPTQASSIAPTQDAVNRRRRIDEDEDEEMAEDEAPAIPEPAPNPNKTPLNLLRSGFEAQKTSWSNKSLTEKYSSNNEYVEFYRMVFDAKHPGENPPPLPHASTWFVDENPSRNLTSSNRSQSTRATHNQPTDGPNSARIRNQNEQDEEELEIASERIRLTCPITLLPFQEPLTSTKCPHSFEKSAILEMLKHSTDHIPFTADQMTELSQIPRQQRPHRERQLRIPQVKCPECNVRLTEDDLRPDAVLQRKVTRLLEARKRDQHDLETSDVDNDNDDDESTQANDKGKGKAIIKGTQRRPVGVGSSPFSSPAKSNAMRMKAERIASSMMPSSPPRPSQNAGLRNDYPQGSQGVVIVDIEEDD